MTRVGLVGGLGPESTIDYYRRLLDVWQREEPGSAPEIVIDSLDVARGLRLVEHDRPALVEYLAASVERLARAGADFVALTANTPHVVFDDLVARSAVPLLSIVETCMEEARRRGLERLLLLGTRFTMEAAFYREVGARHGVTVVVPGADDRRWVHARYVEQLLVGDFRDETRREFVSLVERARREQAIDGVILGGTELPLLLRDDTIAGLPALDTTALHVAAIVRRLREGASPPATGTEPPRHEPTKALYGWITHTDLASADPAATKAWVAKVLGWRFTMELPSPGGPVYLFAYSNAGGGAIRANNPPETPGSIPYVHVADARAAYELALREGAEAMMSPTTVMEGVTIAIVRAPGGVPIGLSGP